MCKFPDTVEIFIYMNKFVVTLIRDRDERLLWTSPVLGFDKAADLQNILGEIKGCLVTLNFAARN